MGFRVKARVRARVRVRVRVGWGSRAHDDPEHEEEAGGDGGVAHGGLVDTHRVDALVHDVRPPFHAGHLEEEQRGRRDVVEVAEGRVRPQPAHRLARGLVEVLAAGARGEAAGEELHAQDAEDEQDEGGDAEHVDHLGVGSW